MRAGILIASAALLSCAGATMSTRADVDRFGQVEFDAPRMKVTGAVVGALKGLGFDVVAIDAERGYVRSTKRAVSDVAPVMTRSGGKVQTYNEYVIRVEPSITGTTRVVMVPGIYWNDKLVSSDGVGIDLDVWRPRWNRFFRAVATNLAPPAARPAPAAVPVPDAFTPPPAEPAPVEPAPSDRAMEPVVAAPPPVEPPPVLAPPPPVLAPPPPVVAPPPPVVAPPPAPKPPPPAPAPVAAPPPAPKPPPPAPAPVAPPPVEAPQDEFVPLPDLDMEPN